MKKNIKNNLLIGAAISGLLVSGGMGAKDMPQADKTKGECHGINSCKGTGDCGGKGYSCAGNNSCKGKGWLSMTKENCDKKGGKFKKS